MKFLLTLCVSFVVAASDCNWATAITDSVEQQLTANATSALNMSGGISMEIGG